MSPPDQAGVALRQPQGLWTLALLVLAVWAAVHAVHFDRFIVHDSWKHIFPLTQRLATSGSCGSLPAWLGTVDNGSPTSVYALSFSLTHPPRLATLYLASCLDLTPTAAAYLHKLQIFLSWLLIALGMYVLGRTLFAHRGSAVYLFALTLFSGACLDATHSDQIASELFWVPWITAALGAWHGRREERDAARYFNLGVLFLAVSLLDHYPHLIAFGALVAASIYLFLYSGPTFRFLARDWRRLWPSLLVLSVAAVQLFFLKGAIADYAPSLRADLVVDPAKFGSTGFVQPTAIVAMLFPLGFLVDYDKLFNTLPLYVYKLDLLLFCFGSIPLLLAICATFAKSMTGRQKIGWLAFLLTILAVSLQQTKLYFLLFHVPFFDVFRGYFLFSMLTVFAFCVFSGYGFDALTACDPHGRRSLLRVSILSFAGAAFVVGVIFIWLVSLVPAPLDTLRRIALPAVFDAAVVLGGLWSVWRAAGAQDGRRWIWRVVLAMVLLQVPFMIGAYRMLAKSSARMMDGYGLDSADYVRAPIEGEARGIGRRLCTTYAQCYLSKRRTVSLNLDLEGTFLRHRDEPVFQAGLSAAAQKALTGLSRPEAWMSRQLTSMPDKSAVLAALNKAPDVGVLLDERTLTRELLASGVPPPAAQMGEVVRIARGVDRLEIEYRAPEGQLLNVASNYGPNWHARVAGRSVPVFHANFGGMAVPVPSGSEKVVFRYIDRPSDAFFLSRLVMLVLSAVGVVWLVRRLRDR